MIALRAARWVDIVAGEVRSLAVRPDAHGQGLGGALVEAVVGDARALGLPRVIALTRRTIRLESGRLVRMRKATSNPSSIRSTKRSLSST